MSISDKEATGGEVVQQLPPDSGSLFREKKNAVRRSLTTHLETSPRMQLVQTETIQARHLSGPYSEDVRTCLNRIAPCIRQDEACVERIQIEGLLD